ncbi:MAG: aspartate kinase, partial [Bdellovibrionales bacterium]|nr:aspartate kinase [Bdellovibrionales bacterium]
MIIWKFGGTSVADGERISALCDIYLNENADEKPGAIVVSALGGTTDTLLELSQHAAGGGDYTTLLESLHQRHSKAASQLGIAHSCPFIDLSFQELAEILKGVFLLRDLSQKTIALIVSFGERLSAQIVTQAFLHRGVATQYLDARELVLTDSRYESARVKRLETTKHIANYFHDHPQLQIVTGFIAANDVGDTTTLGRGGSDYTASLFGAALEASNIHIWTDVDGVLSADPRKVPEAFLLDQISYEEAMELSHFGAKVLHPPTIQPAREKSIPIYIRNSFHPNNPGTCITSKTS